MQPVHSRRRETLTQPHTVASAMIPAVIRNLLGSLQMFSNPGRSDRYAVRPYAFCANQKMEHISETPCFNATIKLDGHHSIRRFVRNRLPVGIAYKPNLLWLVWTDNIKTHCYNESKSLGMLV